MSQLGGHTIGTSACQFFRYRLYNFTTTGNGADPTINPSFLPQLQALCPQNGDATQGVLDWTRVAKTDLTHLSSQTWGMAEDYSSLIKSYGLTPPPEVLLTDCLGQMPSMCSLEGPWWRWATLASSLALKVKFAKCDLNTIRIEHSLFIDVS